MIVGNIIGGNPTSPKMCIFRTEDGQEIQAVRVSSETTFTATANDIREGKTAATDLGVITGTKKIPAYHTTQGYRIIPNGSDLKITSLQDLDKFDFTKLQVLVCDFNTSLSDSVSVNKVIMDYFCYEVLSTTLLSNITINKTDKTIEIGITNNTGAPQILRFFTYKEIE